MRSETEFGSYALTDGRLPGKPIVSGRFASTANHSDQPAIDAERLNPESITPIPCPKTIYETDSSEDDVIRQAIRIDRRSSSRKPSEHGLLRSYSAHITFIQRLVDGLLITGVYFAANHLHGGHWHTEQLLAATLAVFMFLIYAEMYGLYKSWRTSPQHHEIRALISVWAMVVASLLMLAFVTKTSGTLSRLVMMVWFVAIPLVLGALRISIRAVLNQVRRNGANTHSVAIIGNNAIGRRLIRHFETTPWAGLVVKGFFDVRHPKTPSVEVDGETYSVNPIDALLQQARSGEIDSVYIALPFSRGSVIEEVVSQLADTTASVFVVPDSFTSVLVNARWIDFGGMPMLSVHETPFFGLFGLLKRVEDIVLSSLILLLISPLMLGIALAVKATSVGPILFKQRRYGLNGSEVEVWKFRSMTVCEDGANILQATKGDKRVTSLGAFLRKTSLDELPQFINVLQGSMSVVGPRPHAVTHNEQYRQLIKGYMLRHKVKPGITGWAQVNGWRGETDTLDKMKKRVEFDMEYIQNWTLWFDLKIVFLTVIHGFVGKNAY